LFKDNIKIEKFKHIKSFTIKRQLLKIIFLLFIIIYSFVTLIPFYFAFIRSFVPTKLAGKFHFWIPENQQFSLDIQYRNMSIYYNMNLEKFKKDMDLEHVFYINPNLTLRQLSEEYNIPHEKIQNYMNPYYLFNGWIVILSDKKFYTGLFATLFVTTVSIILGSLLAAATSSVLARFKKRWHSILYAVYMMSMVVSRSMILLPLYLIVTKFLYLGNTYLALILVFIQGGCLPVVLFTSYIGTVPEALYESVKMDGGTKVTFFFKVLLPVCKPVFVAYTAIHIPFFWNDLLMGLLFLKKSNYTLTPYLQGIQGMFTTNYQAMYAALFLSFVPIVLLYLVFNKMFLRSQLTGAIKE
jgi:ABC-type glycerol-3-phosphate transport system permease component